MAETFLQTGVRLRISIDTRRKEISLARICTNTDRITMALASVQMKDRSTTLPGPLTRTLTLHTLKSSPRTSQASSEGLSPSRNIATGNSRRRRGGEMGEEGEEEDRKTSKELIPSRGPVSTLSVSAAEMATSYKKLDRCVRRVSGMKIKQTIVKMEKQTDPRRKLVLCSIDGLIVRVSCRI